MKRIGRKKVHRYTPEFRKRVLRSILEDQLGVYEASKYYGISEQSIYKKIFDQ